MEQLLYHISQALGWSILHSLWQGAGLYLLLYGMHLVAPHLRAHSRYTISLAIQTALFMLFVATFVHYFPWVSLSSPEKSEVVFDTLIAFTPVTDTMTVEHIFPYMGLLYVLGFCLQSLLFANGYLRLRALRRHTVTQLPEEWIDIFEKVKSRLHIRQDIALRLSATISVPMALGFFKPLVLFPLAFATQMDIRHVEALLLHELAHIRRHDYLFNLMKVFFETILFFNPFVWLMSRIIDSSREEACDDMVKDIVPKASYAEALLRVELLRNMTSPSLAMASNGNRYILLQRIKKIMDMESNFINVKQQVLTIVLSSIAFACMAWINPAKETIDLKTIHQEKQDTIQKEQLDKILSPMTAPTEADIVQNKVKEEDTLHVPVVAEGSVRPPVPPALEKAAVPAPPIEVGAPDTLQNDWQERVRKIQQDAAKLQSYTQSPQFKKMVANIQKQSQQMARQYDSKQLKKQMAKIEKEAKKMQKHFESKEWKNRMVQIQAEGKNIEEYFESDEWKDQMARVESSTRKIGEYFESQEWKDHISKIEANSQKIEDYFQSDEWQDMIKELGKTGHDK